MLSERFHEVKIPGRAFTDSNVQPTERALEKLCDEVLFKKHNTISEMIEAFFTKNSNIEDLTEAFTVIIPKKLKAKFVLHPPFISLLKMPLEAMRFTLEEFETSHRMNSFQGATGTKETK